MQSSFRLDMNAHRLIRRQLIWIAILWISFFTSAIANTKITYQETRIPMSEAGPKGLEALLVWPNDSKPHPVVLISHGSPRDPNDRPKMSAISYLPIAMQFARRGFSVAVVMRRGYGSSGGDYVENYGSECATANYLRAALASSKDLHAVIQYLSTVASFNIHKILAVGVSAGGFATIALTADQPPQGLVAAISFAGGRGSKADNVICNKNNLIQTFGTLGKTSRIPMLWIYANNDHFFNPTLARQFYNAFSKNGGNAELIIVPDYDDEGHFLFSINGISRWTPIVDDFLKNQHLVLVNKLLPLPDNSNLVAPKILSLNGKQDFEKYVQAAPHKAFALSSDGAYGWRTGERSVEEAKLQAINYCQKYTQELCKIIAVDDEMIK